MKTQTFRKKASSSGSPLGASRRPSRRTVSCENCRARKVKCSRGSPCDHCIKRHESCEWKMNAEPTRPDYPRIYTEVDLLALSKTVDLLASRLGMGSKEVQDTIRFFEMSANFSTESASSGDDDQLHDCNVESPHSPATFSPPTQSRHDSLCAPEGAGASPTSSSVDEDLCFTVSQVEAPVEQKQQAPQPDGVPVFVQEFGNTLLSPPYQYGATQEYFSSALFADTPSCSVAPRLSTFQPPTFGEIADIAQFPGVTDSPSPFPLNIWSLVSTAHGDQLTSRNPFATVAFERPLPLNMG